MNNVKETIIIALKNLLCMFSILLLLQLILYIPDFITIVLGEAKQGSWYSIMSDEMDIYRIMILPLAGIMACRLNYKRLRNRSQSLQIAIIQGIIALICSWFVFGNLEHYVNGIIFGNASLTEWQGTFFTSIFLYLYSFSLPISCSAYWVSHLGYVITKILFVSLKDRA